MSAEETWKRIREIEDALEAGKVLVIHLPHRVARITSRTWENWSQQGNFFQPAGDNGELEMIDSMSGSGHLRYRRIDGCPMELMDPEMVDWQA